MSRVRSACTAGSQLAFCTVALTALLPTHTLASATTFHPCIKTLRRVRRLKDLLMYFIDVYFLLMYIWPIFYTNTNLIDVYTPIAFPEERYPLYRTRNIYLYIYLLFIDVYLYILMYI